MSPVINNPSDDNISFKWIFWFTVAIFAPWLKSLRQFYRGVDMHDWVILTIFVYLDYL